MPADIPLDSQDEEPDRSTTGPALGDLDEKGEDLDEKGLAPEPSPANPIAEDASMTD